MQNKGIYSMVSAFLLTIVLVFIALGLIYLNLFVLSHESQVFEGAKPFEIASDVKTKIIETEYCFDGKITSENLSDKNLFEDCASKLNELSDGQVLGFSVEKMQHLDCDQVENVGGSMQDCSHKFVFFTNVEEDYKKCLAKMVLCMKIKKLEELEEIET